MKRNIVDYRKLRPWNLNSQEFSHLKLLIFWPIFGIAFTLLERGVSWNYHVMYCNLDDLIPFCEYFAVPYFFWYIFIIGFLLYSLLWDVAAFKKFMKFLIITTAVTLIIYIIYPSQQNLRPETLAQDNIFTKWIGDLYRFDNNANVFPSIHVISSMAVMFGAWNSKHLCTPAWRTTFIITTALICASTVLIKQHSLLDMAAALILSFIAYPITYGLQLAPAVQKE